ncbi:DeoR family transcriptional regulator [Rhodocytophaga rosea]|uniref:DeoR family transcriptional regulator n=2 Tax=Rhodocytophaga rosea TaxID=2704465 RepID=A0A6C0GW04_9BACT|nr:DeoR family transcriptional regulator [Rhodocytophaga rosea]
MLSINGIERQAGLSQGIVSKFVHGKRALHPKQVEKLLPVVKLIGYLL